jgi:hypothetical protein
MGYRFSITTQDVSTTSRPSSPNFSSRSIWLSSKCAAGSAHRARGRTIVATDRGRAQLMRVDLKTVAEIANQVVREQDDNLEVVGVSPAGSGAYTEIMIVVKGCRVEPCAISLGVLRDAQSEEELRSTIADKLRTHLASVH